MLPGGRRRSGSILGPARSSPGGSHRALSRVKKTGFTLPVGAGQALSGVLRNASTRPQQGSAAGVAPSRGNFAEGGGPVDDLFVLHHEHSVSLRRGRPARRPAASGLVLSRQPDHHLVGPSRDRHLVFGDHRRRAVRHRHVLCHRLNRTPRDLLVEW